MKQFFTFLFISLCSIAVLQAQVTLTKETHGFIPGQVHESQPIKYQAPGESGKDIVWDFSKITDVTKVSKSATDFETIASGQIKAFRQNDQTTFLYNISELGNEYLGYETATSSLLFSKPLLKTMYPQTFGTYFEGEFEGEYLYATGSYPVTGTYSTHGDAMGTIILPSGESFPALRVHTIQTTNISSSSSSIIEKYLWYTQDVRLPLFVSIQVYSINKNGNKLVSSQQSYFNPEVISKEVSGINLLNEISYKVFPNPFQGVIEVTYDLPQETKVDIELFDSKGTKLATLASQTQTGAVSLSKDVSRYTQIGGTYFLKLQFGDKVYTEKLIRK